VKRVTAVRKANGQGKRFTAEIAENAEGRFFGKELLFCSSSIFLCVLSELGG
jgi:hypothetical protein